MDLRSCDFLLFQIHFLIEEVFVGEKPVENGFDVGHSLKSDFHLKVLVFEGLFFLFDSLELFFVLFEFLFVWRNGSLFLWDFLIEVGLFWGKFVKFVFIALLLPLKFLIPELKKASTWFYIRSFFIFIGGVTLKPKVFGWWFMWEFMWAFPLSFRARLFGLLHKV